MKKLCQKQVFEKEDIICRLNSAIELCVKKRAALFGCKNRLIDQNQILRHICLSVFKERHRRLSSQNKHNEYL